MNPTKENKKFEQDLSKPHVSRQEIEKLLCGIRPKNLENYRRALVHKSVQKYVRNALNENKEVCSYLIEAEKPASNQRLEFFGDSVLDKIVTEYIFHKYIGKDEGFMTRLKTKIVRDTHCVKFANSIGLGQHLLVGPIVKKDANGQYNSKLLEDAFEALIAAIQIDLGDEFVKAYVFNLIDKFVDFTKLYQDDNYKDILMRFAQKNGISLPIYDQISLTGPPHERIFQVQVTIEIDGNKIKMGEGKGSSKKDAEQAAAYETLKLIEENDIKNISERDIF